MKRSLALAAVLLVALVGCAPTEEVAIPDPPAVEPTPTPTPTQAQETGDVRPAAVFDTCDDVFGSGVVDEFVGPVEWSTALNIDEVVFAQARGLACDSVFTETQQGMQIAVVPASAVDTVDEKLTCIKHGLEWGPHHACFVETESNGIRLSGVVTFGSGTIAESTAKTEGLVAGFTAQAATVTVPPAPIPADGAWPLPVECAGVRAEFDAESVLKNPHLEEVSRGGGDVFTPPAVWEVAGGYDDPTTICGWFATEGLSDSQIAAGGYDSLISYNAGGGAWAFDALAANADVTEITVDGADRAAIVARDYFRFILVADGPNLTQISLQGNTDNLGTAYESVSAAFLAALNAAG